MRGWSRQGFALGTRIGVVLIGVIAYVSACENGTLHNMEMIRAHPDYMALWAASLTALLFDLAIGGWEETETPDEQDEDDEDEW